MTCKMKGTPGLIDWCPEGPGGCNSLLYPMFLFRGFHSDQMAIPKPLMTSEVSCCWVICLAPYHLQAGLCCWSGGPTTLSHFPSVMYLLIPLAHPVGLVWGLCSLCQACRKASAAQRTTIRQAVMCALRSPHTKESVLNAQSGAKYPVQTEYKYMFFVSSLCVVTQANV